MRNKKEQPQTKDPPLPVSKRGDSHSEVKNMSESIKVKKEGKVTQVLLNRPETFNAFDLNMIGSLENCLIHLAADDSASALVISGEGKAFCAGGDLKWSSVFRVVLQPLFTNWPPDITKRSWRFVG